MNKYYRDDSFIEHPCCYSAAIVSKCDNGKGNYGGDVLLFAECSDHEVDEYLQILNLKGIYILFNWYNYSDSSIHGVYSSKEKAIEEINKHLSSYNEYATQKGNHDAEYFYKYKVETRNLNE